jgi:hypothetical protein
MVVKGKLKKYLGSITREEDAGKFYDKFAVSIWGFQVSKTTWLMTIFTQAKTNFSYTKEEAINLL